MARYIDVDKKIQETNQNIESLNLLLKNRPYDEVAKEDIKKFEYLIRELNNTPTADVVEVVRCKNCQYFTKEMAIGMCKRVEDKPIIPCSYDHFCSYGERRE